MKKERSKDIRKLHGFKIKEKWVKVVFAVSMDVSHGWSNER